MVRLHTVVVLATLLAFGASSSAFAEKPQAPGTPPVGSTKPNTPAGGGMQHVNPAVMQSPNAIKNADMNGPAKIMQCQKDCEAKFPKVDVAGIEKALNYAMKEEKPNKVKIDKLKSDLERAKARAADRDQKVKQCQSQCSAK